MNKRKFLRKILQDQSFFFEFAKYLDEIFPNGWYEIREHDKEFDVEVMEQSTNGWHGAFNLTCRKLDIEDCLAYYNSLYWIDSDEFDADIAMLLEAIVFDEEGKRLTYEDYFS